MDRQMKRRRYPIWPRKASTEILMGGIVILLLIFAYMESSDASGADKKQIRGYHGSERVRLTEKPVRAKSGETITYGYIGNERVRIHTSTQDGYTITRKGYVGRRRVDIKERKQ